MFIDKDYILGLLEKSKNTSKEEMQRILSRARSRKGLTHLDVAALLTSEDLDVLDEIFKIANEIKHDIYGNRVVMFAPLYVSDYCVNQCRYCGYQCSNQFNRRKLTMEEVKEEVLLLEKMGHKRLALEAGEDPVNCDIDYILDCMRTIYSIKDKNGEIRRVNVNIAATTVENYKKLKEVGIGTYILFQETYHQPTYEYMHVGGPKKNYEYHLTAFDRAMQGGIDDVGGGVLFGLYDAYFEVLGLMIHNEHLEKEYGVGFHTISVPRIQEANGITLDQYPHIPNDETFKKIVAVIRLAVPFTGIIISTRETPQMRKELLNIGVSQISGGSATGVGGYKARESGEDMPQFKVSDERTQAEVLSWLLDEGCIPSFCTACYRKGRTGDRFMFLAKSGNIKNVCTPNAIMTLYEYLLDYGDQELLEKGEKLIHAEVEKIENNTVKSLVLQNLEKMKNKGERDLYL